jgi:hypothetical protein
MSVLYISEYTDAPLYIGQAIPVGVEPAIAQQAVTISGVSAQSAAFNAKTTFIRVHVDGITSLKFGSNPTAVTTELRLAASQTEYFGVIGGQKVAGITNT